MVRWRGQQPRSSESESDRGRTGNVDANSSLEKDTIIQELRKQLSQNAEEMKKSLELSEKETNFQIAAAARKHEKEMAELRRMLLEVAGRKAGNG